MKRFFLDVFFWLYAIFMIPSFLIKGKHKDAFGERFGYLSKDTKAYVEGKSVLWIHAVSVGEVRLAEKLIKGITEKHSSLKIVLTTTTASGRQVALSSLENIAITYFPFDWSCSIDRFLNSIHPKMLVLIETEIWPNLLHTLNLRNIPVIIANGRISDKAIKQYRVVKNLIRPFLKSVSKCLVQSKESANRYVEMGVPAENTIISGNMKFDLALATPGRELKGVIDRFRGDSDTIVVLCASTHENEEEVLATIYNRLISKGVSLRLVIAPRHLERIGKIVSQIQSVGLDVALLTEAVGDSQSDLDGKVLIFNQWGVLNQLYSLVDVVFMGGSLVPVGGHNLTEPAYAARPIIHGKHMNNFKEIRDLFIENDASICVSSAEELESKLLFLAENEHKRSDLGKNAKEITSSNQGATKRNIEEILNDFKTC